jgi:hypothetical protein
MGMSNKRFLGIAGRRSGTWVLIHAIDDQRSENWIDKVQLIKG